MGDKLEKKLVRKYYDQEAGKYIEQYGGSYDKYPANLIRINLISERLKDNNVKTILDIGCGTCGPMIKLLQEGFDVYGTDFAENMISVGKKEIEKAGFDPDRIWVADLEDDTDSENKYDAVLALGVFPHVLDENKALYNMKNMLNEGGLTFIEFRNKLFAAFTFNNYSSELFLNEIINVDGLPGNLGADVKHFFDPIFQKKVDAVRKDDKLIYGDVLAKFHNPLSIDKDLYSPCGFSVRHALFYHYHALPPSFRDRDHNLFNELSMKIEDPYDWRGYFMASAFVIEAGVG